MAEYQVYDPDLDMTTKESVQLTDIMQQLGLELMKRYRRRLRVVLPSATHGYIFDVLDERGRVRVSEHVEHLETDNLSDYVKSFFALYYLRYLIDGHL